LPMPTTSYLIPSLLESDGTWAVKGWLRGTVSHGSRGRAHR
jgi:hypothetical protein